MRFLHISIYVAIVVGICSALPIPSVQAGDRNAFIIGALVFLSFGAVLTGCVCCRRRKKGFEEFTNESGTQDAIKNEYPIFRALSPESQRNQLETVNNNQGLNNSHENLIVEDVDNNNGPISPSDLENIENNNAVDYIQNQNEIDIIIEPSLLEEEEAAVVTAAIAGPEMVEVHMENDFGLLAAAAPSTSDHFISHVIQDVAVSSTTVDTTTTTATVPHMLHMTMIGDGTSNEDTFVNTIVLEENVPIVRNEAKIVTKECNTVEESESESIATCRVVAVESAVDKEPNVVKVETTCLEMCPQRDCEDTESVKSEASEKTSEVSSVEEALRVLDSAIENEDDDDDSDSLPDEDLEDVLRDLMKNRVETLEDLQNPKEDTHNPEEYVREQALELVEEILNESQLVAEERVKNIEDCTFDMEKVQKEEMVQNCTFDLGKLPPKEDGITIDMAYADSPDVLHKVDSFEDFFDDETLAKTSTPCVKGKFAVSTKTSARKGVFSQKLFNDGSPIVDVTTEKLASPLINNATFDATFDVEMLPNPPSPGENDFTYPGDPCTSKQAIERDQILVIKCQRDSDITSEELNTITPVNTPIELNYNQETWNRMTMGKHQMDEDTKNGWFLHPQMNCDENVINNETIDIVTGEDEEENEENLELTFEALRKQLAEVLPQPQGMAGPAEFSDDEEDPNTNRTFDEYRSPLDGIFGLLEIDNNSPAKEPQNEMFINYKRSLSPIMEESEEETCRTFAVNETKCVDNSTSTGCMETGEALMGVPKTLMASNDTLFNFEDTLGDKEDLFSPRLSSRNTSLATTPVKYGKSASGNNSQATTITTSSDTEKVEELVARRVPPKTIEFIEACLVGGDDLCSPDQQKTFSEGTTSSERLSSDISPTLDNEATFTTNTNEDKTCVTVIIKDDERLSEVSEPEWGSTASYNNAAVACEDTNSLADVPSLDYNVNNFEEHEELDKDSGHDDSGHSTQASTDGGKSNTSHNISDSNEEEPFELKQSHVEIGTIGLKTNKSLLKTARNIKAGVVADNNCKENTDPNIIGGPGADAVMPKISSYQKVQINSQDAVIIDKTKTNGVSSVEYNNGDNEGTTATTQTVTNRLNDKFAFYQSELAPIVYYQTLSNDYRNITSDGIKTPDTTGMRNDDVTASSGKCAHVVADDYGKFLSGEEDPWAEPIQHTYRLPVQSDDFITTSFTNKSDDEVEAESNEWDSDIDDSHDSSEEFMYVPGAPIDDHIRNYSTSDDNQEKQSDEEVLNSNDLWSSHDDKIRVKVEANEEVSDDSSSDMEGEFVPSCWNSAAMPARSAMKSPDKSSSEEEGQQADNKKRRSVVFKKQRYFSVYEYPKENVPLSPAYSDSNLWKKTRDDFITNSTVDKSEVVEDLSDGFTVSSSTRPFHGSQFNVFCHTWPTDAEFSWSQESPENRLDENKKYVTYSDIDLKWSDKYSDFDGKREDEGQRTEDTKRPDSGVGESAEMLLDRPTPPTIGELCHTKSTLRLPIEGFSPPASANAIDATKFAAVADTTQTKIEVSEHRRLFPEEVVLPTPSCTGSMDSLNSTSSSERQLSFSTFNKRDSSTADRHMINSSNQNSSSCSDSFNGILLSDTNTNLTRPPGISIILYEDDALPAGGDKIKQSDSTDEDSGIESIMRISK